jgi:hypothetical protein
MNSSSLPKRVSPGVLASCRSFAAGSVRTKHSAWRFPDLASVQMSTCAAPFSAQFLDRAGQACRVAVFGQGFHSTRIVADARRRFCALAAIAGRVCDSHVTRRLRAPTLDYRFAGAALRQTVGFSACATCPAQGAYSRSSCPGTSSRDCRERQTIQVLAMFATAQIANCRANTFVG